MLDDTWIVWSLFSFLCFSQAATVLKQHRQQWTALVFVAHSYFQLLCSLFVLVVSQVDWLDDARFYRPINSWQSNDHSDTRVFQRTVSASETIATLRSTLVRVHAC